MRKRKIWRNRKLRGSLTVFAALTFMLVAQLLFVLAEGCRQVEMAKVAKMNTDSVVESLMAEYCRPLWEEYHLLANDIGGTESSVNTGYMTAFMTALSAKDFETGQGTPGFSRYNLLRPDLTGIEYGSYTLLTDLHGKAYGQLVAAYMQNNLLYESAKKIYNSFEASQTVEKTGSFNDQMLNDALNQMKGGSASAGGEKPSTGEGSAETEISEEEKAKAEQSKKMLEDVKELQKKDILTLVVPAGRSISEAVIPMKELVSHRSLSKGLNPMKDTISWYENVLLQQYLLTYLSCFTQKNTKEGGAAYELEYLIGGKDSDRENLKTAVREILVIREASNMLSLLADPTKKSEAAAMATSIAAAILNPELEPLFETGVLAAWAFCESILDLRALLNGKQITLMKSSEAWTSQLSNLSLLLNGSADAMDCPGGLDYRGYLGILLLGKSTEVMTMRGMDMQEWRIRHMEGYGAFRMDHCISSVSFTASYAYKPIFYSFVYLIYADSGELSIHNHGAYSYLKNLNGG